MKTKNVGEIQLSMDTDLGKLPFYISNVNSLEAAQRTVRKFCSTYANLADKHPFFSYSLITSKKIYSYALNSNGKIIKSRVRKCTNKDDRYFDHIKPYECSSEGEE